MEDAIIRLFQGIYSLQLWSLKVGKAEKSQKAGFYLQSDFLKQKYLISIDVLNPESEQLAQSHDNGFQRQC